MKQIILSQNPRVVSFRNLEADCNLYYGVQIYGHRYFIQSESYQSILKADSEKCKWYLRRHEGLTRMNGSAVEILELSTLKEYIHQLLNIGGKVFVFDKFMELAAWLDEKD